MAVGDPRSVLSSQAQVEQSEDQGYTLFPLLHAVPKQQHHWSWHSFLVPLFSSQNAFSRSCYLYQNKIKVTSFDISNYNAHALAFLGTPWNSFLLPFFCFAIWGLPSTDIFSWPSYTIACSLHAMLTRVFCSVFQRKGMSAHM